MNHLPLKIFKITAEVLLILFVLFAIMLGIARLYFPHIDSYKPYFEKWASEALHMPVKIGKVQAAWKGLHPLLRMEEVEILDAKSNLPLLHTQRLQVGVNITRSLLRKQLVPSSIAILGTHIRVHRIDAHTVEINGVPLSFQSDKTSDIHTSEVIAWVLSQGQIRLEDVDLDWQNQEDQLFQVTHLTAVLSNGFFKHQIIGVGTLIEKIPTKFRFVINLTQGGASVAQVRAECFVFIKDLDVIPFLKNKSFYDVQIKEGMLNRLRLWTVWENNQWQQLQAVFQLNQTVLNTPSLGHINIDQFAANLAWQRQPDGFSLAADQIKLTINQESLPLTQFSMQQSQIGDQPSIQIIRADKLDLNQLRKLTKNVASFPSALKTYLDAIQPQGNLDHILLRREVPATGDASISMSTDFSELKTFAWRNIPAVDGLQGSLYLTPNAGELELDGNTLMLDAPSWFDHPFTLAQYQANVQWIQQSEGLKIQADDINFSDNNVAMRGQLNMWLPPENTPYVQLLAAFTEHDASHIRDYLPKKLMHTHPALSTWLTEAFTTGDNVDGQLLLQGPLKNFPFDDHTGRFEAIAHVKNMQFNYKTGWPTIDHLDADALFNGRRLDISAPKANIFSAFATDMKAQIPDLAHAKLDVQGNVKADMKDGLRFIAESPLQKKIGEGLENLTLHGDMQLGLRLQIPLYHGDDTSKVQGDVVVLPNGKLGVPAWNIHLTDFTGAFTFTENGLYAKQLTAKWLKQPISINIDTSSNASNNSTIEAKIKGHATVEKIKKEYGLDLKNKIIGATDYVAQLQISRQKEHLQTIVSLNTDLQGVAIDLPAPLKKTADEKIPTYVEIKTPQKTNLNVFLQYAKKISAAIIFAQGKEKTWHLQSGDIRLGEEPAEFQNAPGLVIDGYLPQLVWSDVKADLSPYFSTYSLDQKKQENNFWRPKEIDLDIDKLSAFGMTLSSVNIFAQPQSQSWEVEIDSPTIVGQLTIPNDLSKSIVGNFDRFNLVTSDTKTTNEINPGDIPPLDLHFKNFIYGTKPLGHVLLQTFSEKNVLQIHHLNIDTGNTHLTATGRWQQIDKEHQQTTLSGNLQSDNIGAALKTWQVTSSVVDGNGSAAFALSWPAAAYDFSAKQLNGSFSLAFAKGSIVNIGDGKEAEIGMGRILNLLSLQSIPRRLSLDFSDLVSKGFPFDEMKGDFSMQTGNAVTNNAYLKGPIAKVEIKGRIGLGNKDYDLRMITTPYVTSSLPVAATLVGGPIAGAATWLGNKVLGGVVDKIVADTYGVKGSWNDPVVEKISERAANS